MITPFYLGKHNRKQEFMLYELVTQCRDPDFYITQNNQRHYVDSPLKLRQFIKSALEVYKYENEDGDIDGVVLVWKSLGANIKRYYVKLVARSPKISEKLLTAINWNFHDELFVKIHKTSPHVNVFKRKGFRFEGDRGKQVLLHRNKFQPPIRSEAQDKDIDDSTN